MEAPLAGSAALAALISVVGVKKSQNKDQRLRNENRQRAVLTVSVVALLLWPAIFHAIVGLRTLEVSPYTLAGFAWPVVMIAYLSMTECKEHEVESMAHKRISDQRHTATNIIAAAFAVGALLNVVRNNKSSVQGANIMLASLVLLIAFVVPSIVDSDVRQPGQAAIRAAQRHVLHYAIGLFVTGIIVTWTVQ
jgi:hypothetical protein